MNIGEGHPGSDVVETAELLSVIAQLFRQRRGDDIYRGDRRRRLRQFVGNVMQKTSRAARILQFLKTEFTRSLFTRPPRRRLSV
jgi:hypothetical protein